ncbi:MAG: 50S ribosomal protein L21 [Anaerolineae bacterium]|nr:50S ribosomal protein L21 [Anaerolineae bacterium]
MEGDYSARFDATEQTRVQLEREKAECSALAEKLRVELEQAQAELAARASVVAPEKELGQTLARADSTLEVEAETPSTPASVTEHKRRARQTIAPPASRDPEDETPYETACPQHLSDVYGIGSVFEQRLYGAGIGTFWQLYKMPFDQLRQILNLTGLQKESVDLKVIRADALRLAKETASKGRLWNGTLPDDLEPLEGIGPVYEKRLYDAGICTYAALAQTTPKQLEAICGAGGVRKPNFKAWIKQAQKLAARKK